MKLYLVIACLSLLSAGSALAASGADIYASKCKMCHAADGSGSTPAGKSLKVLSFTSPDLVKAPDAQLIASTTSGKGKMPAFSGKLTPEEIKDVVAYIRTLQK